MDWETLPEHQIEVVYDKWQELPEAQRVAIERRFEDAEELNSDHGIQALIDECAVSWRGHFCRMGTRGVDIVSGSHFVGRLEPPPRI